MSHSRLYYLSAQVLTDCVEVASDILEYEIAAEVEPCGQYCWVTTETETELDAVHDTYCGGHECGAI